ncbi:growth hormone-regulated TBC protein 1 [Rhizophagus clarus]|uniref:Growth hormone-regulated TBC protein 1 n=1 Tax=Rhizophagus clarus TaxID=94130 RepID=A0A8H3LK96_9GLOM|nr:growth hormone-regulated TBC protein 1 [Rhizophagus clarus]
MLAETSSPRDSYYSSLFDEYSSRGEERTCNGSTWNHTTNAVKKRPSLNLHPRSNSISSLKRQPSFDCPSPAFSNLVSSNYSSPLNSLFNYKTASGSFSPPPPSPGYVFTHFSSYNNVGTRESLTSNKIEERSNSLTVPLDTKRSSAENRTSSPSGSSILEDYNDYHTRPSSASSFEDTPNSVSLEVTPTKSHSQHVIDEHMQQHQDNDRDQYGFRRSFQWITRKEYNEFESSYIQVLHRRKQKWDAAIAENGGVIPDRCSKMKRYVRKGIPPSLRGEAWFHFSGAEAKMRDHMDFYQQLLIKAQDPRYENDYVEVIERDLHRTFPENIKFKSTVVSEDEKAFWILSGGFGWDVEKLDGNMPTITLVTSHWFLTLYINILPIETLLRVWDCLFYEATDDPMEIFQVVQNMPKCLLDCHKLIDVCFRRRKGVADISQKDIDRHRELIHLQYIYGNCFF